eukprot:185387_1
MSASERIKTNRKRRFEEIDDETQLCVPTNPPKKRQKLNENNNSTNHKPEKITLPAEILKFNAESNTYSVQLTNNSLGAKTSHTTQTTIDIDAKFIII